MFRSCALRVPAVVLSLVLALGAILAAKDGDKPKGPPPGKDALVFDLAGDGIDLSAVVSSQLIGNAPGKFHWTKKDTKNAFLVVDADAAMKQGIKIMKAGKETIHGQALFRGDMVATFKKDQFKSNVQSVGAVWPALRDLDTNRDGKINASDPVWSALFAWVDKDGNGAIEAGELQGLEAAGVKEITLPEGDPDAMAKNDDAGNQHVDSEFTKADGKTGVCQSVTLAPGK